MNHRSLGRKSRNALRFALGLLPYALILTLCTLLSASFAYGADRLLMRDQGGTDTVYALNVDGTVATVNNAVLAKALYEQAKTLEEQQKIISALQDKLKRLENQMAKVKWIELMECVH